MSDVTEGLDQLKEKVEGYLKNLELAYEVRPDGSLWIRHGSTLVVISLAEWGDRTLVKLAAPVALELTSISSSLTRFLVERNYELLFGKFSLDVEGDAVWYEHVLLGDFLDQEEFYVAIATIASTADEYDEKVAEMAMGKRVADIGGS